MSGTPNMTITRVTKDKNFTCLNTAIIFDCSLSDTARILLLQMLSVPESAFQKHSICSEKSFCSEKI